MGGLSRSGAVLIQLDPYFSKWEHSSNASVHMRYIHGFGFTMLSGS